MQALQYVRVSTKEQRDGLSFEMQARECERLAKVNGDEVEVVYFDVQTGRTIDKRQGLNEATARAKSVQGTRIYVWRSDRLSRGGRKDLELLDDLRSAGVQVISATEGDLTLSDPDSEFMGFIRAGLNQRECRLISMRTRAVLKQKAENGERLGAPRFGYKVVYSGERNAKGKLIGHLVPIPSQQQTIDRICKLHGEGVSVRRIAVELNTPASTVYKVIRRAEAVS